MTARSEARNRHACAVCGADFRRLERSHATECSLRCRLLSKVEVVDGCWRWTGTLSRGYGEMALSRRSRHVKAHRLSFEEFVGPIPDGMELDHVCHSVSTSLCSGGAGCVHRRCVNPAHLEPVPHSENLRRGVRIGHFANANVCRKGHDWDAHPPELARRRNGVVTRRCWVCRTERRTGLPHSCDRCAEGVAA